MIDRPGFEKLYRKISDKAWEDTEKLIKYQSKRGLTVELKDLKGGVSKSRDASTHPHISYTTLPI